MPNHLNLFLRDEAHRHAVERDEVPRLKRPMFILPLLIFSVFIVIGALTLPQGITDIQDGHALRSRGQRAPALITRMFTSKGKRTYYHIDYTYHTPGDPHPHQRSATLDPQRWEATCQGCHIEILYDPANPEMSRVPSEWPLANGSGLTLLGLLFLGMGLLLTWSLLDEQLRHYRLQRSPLRMGTILAISEQKRGKNTYLDLTLQLDGDDTTLTYACFASPHRANPPQVGQRVAAIYRSADRFILA